MKNYKSRKFIKFSLKQRKQTKKSNLSKLWAVMKILKKTYSYETSAYQKSKSLMCFVIFWPLKLPLVFCVFDKSAAILRIRIKALAAGPYLYMGVTNFILCCHVHLTFFILTVHSVIVSQKSKDVDYFLVPVLRKFHVSIMDVRISLWM